MVHPVYSGGESVIWVQGREAVGLSAAL